MARPVRVEFENAVYHVTARGNERRDIHLNPVRPKDKRRPVPVKRPGELARYHWSSHRAYAGLGDTQPPDWLCTEWLTYFGRTQKAAQAEYRHQIAEMFGQVAISPWKDLRGGLVLGSDTLWNRVCGLMAEAESEEEIRWSRRAGAEAVAKQINRLASEQTDRRIAIWLKVRHGGQRTTDVAKEYGYSDSSGAYRVVQRLETRAKKDHELRHQLRLLKRQLSDVRS